MQKVFALHRLKVETLQNGDDAGEVVDSERYRLSIGDTVADVAVVAAVSIRRQYPIDARSNWQVLVHVLHRVDFIKHGRVVIAVGYNNVDVTAAHVLHADTSLLLDRNHQLDHVSRFPVERLVDVDRTCLCIDCKPVQVVTAQNLVA